MARTDEHVNAIWSKLSGMFDDESTSDFTIVVGTERIAVHKMILSLHSEVFKTMFKSNMK